DGYRFCVRHPALTKARGGIVFVHPFGEELNKSRRVVATQGRALSAAGWDVLQVDLFGCGDSDGDFAHATWERWGDDVILAYDWLRQRATGPMWLWGLRTGCLLASELASRLSEAVGLLLWQPVLSGRQYLQQVLRLKLVNEILGDDRSARGVQSLRRELAERGILEIGGYTLSESLASGLEQAELLAPGRGTPVTWIEVSSQDDA